jgi:hypothetical protein
LLALKPVPPLYAASIVYVPASTPDSEKLASAVPPETVPDVAVPIVVAPFLTVNVTVPALTAGPLAGVTVELSVTEASPYVAVALEAAVVVLTVPALMVRVRRFELVGPGPWH